jgi:hypothetical protein
MNCHEYEEALSEYVDGTPLDATRRDALDAHLAGCARCRAIADDLRTLRDAARRLERREPPAHVWTRIAAEVAGEALPAEAAPLPAEAGSHRFLNVASAFRRKDLLAAAAVLLVIAGGSFIAWRAVTPAAAPSAAVAPAAQGTAPDPELVQDVETELKLAEEHYVKAIAGLEAIAKAEGSELDPQTAQVLQSNLTVIDAVIGESREALRTEPSSAVAQESLFEALSSKVKLLQNTIALINEMRKGNQEGAARIVSGLNQ